MVGAKGSAIRNAEHSQLGREKSAFGPVNEKRGNEQSDDEKEADRRHFCFKSQVV